MWKVTAFYSEEMVTHWHYVYKDPRTILRIRQMLISFNILFSSHVDSAKWNCPYFAGKGFPGSGPSPEPLLECM